MVSRIPIACVLVCALSFSAYAGSAHAFQLISADEASKPEDPTGSRGISRGPKVIPVSPAPTAGFIKSPFNWRVKFEAFGGAHIDKDMVVVTYRKNPSIDLTQRLQPFIQPTGISLDGAEVPPGEHRIRIDVKDSNGRWSTAEMTIKVAE
jgi:hypothetical protein